MRPAPLSTMLGVTLLTACASFHAEPLEDRDTAAVLASPDRGVLAQAASQLRHPRLPPVTIDFSKPLDADALAAIAVIANPDLRTLRLQQRVAEAQVAAAGLLPDPQLTLGFDRVMAPSDQGLVTAFAGSLTLDLLGALVTRGIELKAARTAAEQVRLDIAWQEWTTAGQAWVLAQRLPRQRSAAQLSRQAAFVADHALLRALDAAEHGDVKGDEVEARRIAAADADGRALTAERDAEASRLDLNRLLGLRPDEMPVIAAPAPLTDWRPPDADALFAEARGARLDLQALTKGYDTQQIAVRRAVLAQYPRLGITLNRARDTSAVHTFGPAVTFDLPIFGRSRNAVQAAQLDRERLRSEYTARLFQTRADIAALVSALDHDEAARRDLADQLPKLDTIADHFEQAARRGDVAAPVAESARASVVDKRLAWLALDQSCAEQRVALVLAVGRPLSSSDRSSSVSP